MFRNFSHNYLIKLLEYDFFITFLLGVSIISKLCPFDLANLIAESRSSKKICTFFSGFEVPVQQKILFKCVLCASTLVSHHFFELFKPDCIADLVG